MIEKNIYIYFQNIFVLKNEDAFNETIHFKSDRKKLFT